MAFSHTLRSWGAQLLPRQKEWQNFFFKPTILWSGKEVQLLLFPGKAMRLLAILMFCKSYLRSWLREPLSNTYLSLKNSDLHCQGYLNHSRNSPRLTELVCNFELHPTIVCKRQKLFHEQNDVDTPLFFFEMRTSMYEWVRQSCRTLYVKMTA